MLESNLSNFVKSYSRTFQSFKRPSNNLWRNINKLPEPVSGTREKNGIKETPPLVRKHERNDFEVNFWAELGGPTEKEPSSVGSSLFYAKITASLHDERGRREGYSCPTGSNRANTERRKERKEKLLFRRSLTSLMKHFFFFLMLFPNRIMCCFVMYVTW